MGLFDMFTQEGKLKRHIRRMSDRDAQAEDREASARWLAEESSPKAIMGLLSRFDMSTSNELKDRAEKNVIYRLARDLGADALKEPNRAWMRRAKQYAWPLRLMVELEGEEAAVTTVLDLLAGDVGKATFEPERRKELLVWLAQHRHPQVVEHVQPFLKDFDEEVRYAAGEALVAQEDDTARGALLSVLADPSEESIRLKHRLARVFQERGWPVGDVPLSDLPHGFQVRGDRIVGTA